MHSLLLTIPLLTYALHTAQLLYRESHDKIMDERTVALAHLVFSANPCIQVLVCKSKVRITIIQNGMLWRTLGHLMYIKFQSFTPIKVQLIPSSVSPQYDMLCSGVGVSSQPLAFYSNLNG